MDEHSDPLNDRVGGIERGRAFNFIRGRFADGSESVSDAPDRVARALELALAELPPAPARAESGTLSLSGAGAKAVYLRTSLGVHELVHAVVLPADAGEAERHRAEEVLAGRYGPDPDAALRELGMRIERLPLSRAAGLVTDRFLRAEELAPPPPIRRRPARRHEPRARPLERLAWIAAVLCATAVGFVAGRVLELPSSLPGPLGGHGLHERLAVLEVEQGAGLSQLRDEWQREQARQRRALAAQKTDLALLAERLAAIEPAPMAGVESGAASELPAVSAQPPPGPEPAGAASQAPQFAAEPTPPLVARSAPGRAPVPAGPAAGAAAAPGPELQVVANVLWVRDGPGIEHRRLSRLEAGARVVLAGSDQDGWSLIETPVRGWIASRFVAPVVELP